MLQEQLVYSTDLLVESESWAICIALIDAHERKTESSLPLSFTATQLVQAEIKNKSFTTPGV